MNRTEHAAHRIESRRPTALIDNGRTSRRRLGKGEPDGHRRPTTPHHRTPQRNYTPDHTREPARG